MKRTLLGLVIALSAAQIVSCVPLECTEVGCSIDEGVQIRVKGVSSTFASDLPVTLVACVNKACRTFTVEDVNGTVECKDAENPGSLEAFCSAFDGDVDITVTATLGDEASVQVSISDASGGPLFDETQSVTIVDTYPNGEGCAPTCREGKATFIP